LPIDETERANSAMLPDGCIGSPAWGDRAEPPRTITMWTHRERTTGSAQGGRGSQAATPGKTTLVDPLYGAGPARNGEPEQARTAPGTQSRLTQPGAQAPDAQTQGAPAPSDDRAAGASSNATASTSNAPPARYNIIPHDTSPLSAPGEEIIFGAVYTGANPEQYQLVFTCAGGDFNTPGSGVRSGTFPGLSKRNLYFHIPASWNKRSAITAKLELQKVADHSVVDTVNWTFGPKVNVPTTVDQIEDASERNLGMIYNYKVGPDLGNDHRDDYLHQTVLETFGTMHSNLTVAELKPAWARRHGITTDQAITDYFFGTPGDNGTFTISAGDRFQDQHGGGVPEKAQVEEALTTMKEVTCDLPQTYSATPGTPLGNLTVRRVLKVNGDQKVKKWKR
jgi:hypothetical protein